MNVFSRKKEINLLLNSISNHKIKVITGVRRCGKSYLLQILLPLALKEAGFAANDNDVLIINLKNRYITNSLNLYRVLTSNDNKSRFIIIDEIQTIPSYHDVLIKFFLENKDRDIFITGSNSKILSSEIIKHLQEFGQEIHLNPLSYKEMKEVIPHYSFIDYLKFGGIPIVVNASGPNKKEYELNYIYKEIYEADIKDRIAHNFTYISNSKINQILTCIFSTTSEISISGIASRFVKGSTNKNIDILKLKSEIEDVIQIFIDSYLLIEFDNDYFNGEDILKNIGKSKKYYCVDNGFIFLNCLDQDRLLTILFENTFFVYFMTKGLYPRGKVFLNKENKRNGEIDFNYSISNLNYHLQVTYKLTDHNYDTEVGNLLFFNDDSIKYVVYYLEDFTNKKHPHVKFIKCEDFLLNDDI